MANVVVTGGAGFIGSHLVPILLMRGHSVTVLDNLHPQVHASKPDVASGASFIEGDVRDLELMSRTVREADVVVHLAAETGTGQSEIEIDRYVSVNTLGTATVLRSMVTDERKRHIVLASSRAIFGEGPYWCDTCSMSFVADNRDPDALSAGQFDVPCPDCGGAAVSLPMSVDTQPQPSSVYGWTKLQQEELTRHAVFSGQVVASVLRLFNVYGPGQSPTNPYVGVLGAFYRAIVANRPIELYEDGTPSRDFVYVADVADAFARAVDHPPETQYVLSVGSGSSTSLSEIAMGLGRVLERDPQASVSGRFRVGDIRHASARVEAPNILGWQPRVGFAEGVAEYVHWARAQKIASTDIDSAASDELSRAGVLRDSSTE